MSQDRIDGYHVDLQLECVLLLAIHVIWVSIMRYSLF